MIALSKKPLTYIVAYTLSLCLGTSIMYAHANTQDGIVAQVNDEIILKSELQSAMQSIATQARANGTLLSQTQLHNEALDALIARKLQLGIIKRADFVLNEEIINRQLLQIAQSQGFNSLQALQQSLDKKAAGSYAALRQDVIEEATLSALSQQQVASRIQISNADIQAFLASAEAKNLNPTEYRTIHVRIPYLADYQKLTYEQQQAALEVAGRVRYALEDGQSLIDAMRYAKKDYPKELQGADTGYNQARALPNELVNAIITMQKGQVSPPIVTPDGIDIVMLTDKRSSNAMIVPEWHTRHILVRVDNLQGQEVAKQRIETLYQQLQQGADFETLAMTYSEDTGSATQKGSLGWVNEGQMVPEFEKMMKNTQKGDFSTPFATQFGWHILKVDDTRQRDATNEYRRAAAEEILFNRLAPQAQEDWLQELRSSAYIKIYPQK